MLYSNGRYCISAIQRIVQQIQRIVQQKQKLDSKNKNCTDSPEKMQKKQKMYREDGRLFAVQLLKQKYNY